MLTFKKTEIGLPALFMISSLVVLGSASSVFANNSGSADDKAVFNSLESVQITCVANDGEQESDRELTAKLVNLMSSSKPEERINALSQLTGKSSIDAGAVQKILQAAIRDNDSNVRAQAVYAVARQNCGDASLILEQAMQDSELSVRLMAIDSLGTDERSTHLLEQALNDAEEAIRELAAMKLESLSNSSKTQ